jgi:hypothetical protein
MASASATPLTAKLDGVVVFSERPETPHHRKYDGPKHEARPERIPVHRGLRITVRLGSLHDADCPMDQPHGRRGPDNRSLTRAAQHVAMLRVVLIVLIVALGADVIFYDGEYTQSAASVATSVIERNVVLRFSR